jgi:ABC-type dipeptide/oligopeptide/nickel transport system permease subunit
MKPAQRKAHRQLVSSNWKVLRREISPANLAPLWVDLAVLTGSALLVTYLAARLCRWDEREN